MDATNVGFSLAVLVTAGIGLAAPEISKRYKLLGVYLGLPVLGLIAALPGLRGTTGMVLGLCYFAVASLLAISALATANRSRRGSDLGMLLAHIYIAGGGVWLTTYGAQWELLGFANEWTLLTAAHFHAAGAGATAFTALVYRATGQGAWLIALHPVAYLCVATGLLGVPYLERVGACLYVILFAYQAKVVWGARLNYAVIAAAAVPLVTIALALNWAFGGAHLSFDEMVWFHGISNAVGHVALGLGGFAWAARSDDDHEH